METPTARWERTRAEARTMAKPDGFVLETSFSNSQPMHGWTAEHAVRELWQNLRDGVVASFDMGVTDTLVPTITATTRRLAGRLELKLGGVAVGSVDACTADTLVFRQLYAVLQPRHLALSSVKDGNVNGGRAAGAHGEGFKVAVNFLLRRGFSVTYTMDRQRWSFEHRALHDADVRNMVVIMKHAEAREDLLIEIHGPGAGALFQLNSDWELMRASQSQSLARGAVLPPVLRAYREELVVTADPTMVGRVYNKCLFVDRSDGIASLGLAVNLDLDLQRDRQALPANLATKLADALQSAMSVNGSTDPQVVAVCRHLIAKFGEGHRDAEPFAAVLREILRTFVAQQLDVEPAMIIFLPAAGTAIFAELTDLGFLPQANAGSLSERWDVDKFALARVATFDDWEAPAGEPACRLAWLTQLLQALLGICDPYWGEHMKMCVKRFPPASRAYFGRLQYNKADAKYNFFLSPSCLMELEGWRIAAQMMCGEIFNQCMANGKHARLAAASVAFLGSPQAFRAAEWATREVRASVIDTSGNGAGSASSSAAGSGVSTPASGGSASSMPASPPASPAPKARRSPPDIKLADTRAQQMAAVHPPAFEGVQTSLPGNESTFEDSAVTCRVPTISEFVEIPVYVPCGKTINVLFDAALLGTEDGIDEMHTLMPACIAECEAVLSNVRRALSIPTLPIVYVVCAGVLGFNYRGAVYINLWPLTRPRAPTDPRTAEDFLQVLLHEVAHWREKHHDENFATLLARLVFACRNCIPTA